MNKKIIWKKYVFTSFLTMVILSLFTYSYLVYDTLVSYDVSFEKHEEISQDLIMYKIDELYNMDPVINLSKQNILQN